MKEIEIVTIDCEECRSQNVELIDSNYKSELWSRENVYKCKDCGHTFTEYD